MAYVPDDIPDTGFGDALIAFLDESRVLFERDMLGTLVVQGGFEV